MNVSSLCWTMSHYRTTPPLEWKPYPIHESPKLPLTPKADNSLRTNYSTTFHFTGAHKVHKRSYLKPRVNEGEVAITQGVCEGVEGWGGAGQVPSIGQEVRTRLKSCNVTHGLVRRRTVTSLIDSFHSLKRFELREVDWKSLQCGLQCTKKKLMFINAISRLTFYLRAYKPMSFEYVCEWLVN